MMKNFDSFNTAGKEMMDNSLKSFASFSKAYQNLAAESGEYAKKQMELGAGFFEKLTAAKSFDKAIELQTEYAKTSYESFVAQATKMGELYADIAKEAYKPFEAAAAKVAK